MKSISQYITESRNIEKWYGVSIKHKDFVEVLGHAICPQYKGETEDEMKTRFVKDRHEQLINFFRIELKDAEQKHDEDKIDKMKEIINKPFDVDKSKENYIFWRESDDE